MIINLIILLIFLSLLLNLLYTIFNILYTKIPQLYDTNLKSLPKVSVMRPIKNNDFEMDINTEALYNINYPNFEIIFGVDSVDEPCFPIIENISKKYPNIKTKIVFTGKVKIFNPKIETLMAMEKVCTGDLLWVTDSNTRVDKNMLISLVKEYLERDSKLVFSPICGTNSQTLGSLLENIYINHFISGNIIGSWRLFRIPIIVGKSLLIEKKTLELMGGFQSFKYYLAEDYMMGLIYKKRGFSVSTNYIWIKNINSITTFKGFMDRVSRWAKMRFNINPFIYIFEIIPNTFGLMLIFSPIYFNVNIFILAILTKILLEYFSFIFINNNDRKRLLINLIFPLSVVLKDILLLFLYFVPFFNRTVNWRGKDIKIGKYSKILLEGVLPDIPIKEVSL